VDGVASFPVQSAGKSEVSGVGIQMKLKREKITTFFVKIEVLKTIFDSLEFASGIF
jgi:hypothetical protein